MDLKEQQMGSEEQRVVLHTLAEHTARTKAKFLEIGSWCGDSTLILGNVAKRIGGFLYCIDWWKGNDDSYLREIASREDVFFYFWERIKREGLEDVVIPIRGRSEVVFDVLAQNTFDLVFIDADHRYEGVLRDIQKCLPLIRSDKGILCGHDCEGFISDFDPSFLEAGKGIDDHESVHCGVVLAVGETFKDYSINHSIWSVRAAGSPNQWKPTNFTFEGIKDQRRATPPPIASTKNYALFRYGAAVYAVPNTLGDFDIRAESLRKNPKVISSSTLLELEKAIGENLSFTALPTFVDTYRGFNLVEHKDKIYAIDQTLGSIDLINAEPETMRKWQSDKRVFIASSTDEAKIFVADLRYDLLEKEWEKQDRDISTLHADIKKKNEHIAVLNKDIEDFQIRFAKQGKRLGFFRSAIAKIKSTRWYRLVDWVKKWR